MTSPLYKIFRSSLPLGDAVEAVFAMKNADYTVNWRHDFIVAITTLRATGHVLHKVDTKRFPEIADEVDARFKRWKQGLDDDQIFVDLIENSRNELLKAYEFPARDSVVFFPEELESRDIDSVATGPLKGSDTVAALQFACRWWENELSEISRHIDPARLRKLGG